MDETEFRDMADRGAARLKEEIDRFMAAPADYHYEGGPYEAVQIRVKTANSSWKTVAVSLTLDVGELEVTGLLSPSEITPYSIHLLRKLGKQAQMIVNQMKENADEIRRNN